MDEWINFRHLYAFWMVARTGNFTKAAKEMRVAQSAVSSQVASLEEYLEEQLLVRTNRSVEVTEAGTKLLGYANHIFSQSRTINTLFRDKEQLGINRNVRVGVVGGASRNFVYRLLDGYVRDVDNVHISVSTGSYSELYALLKKFMLDAIISLDPPEKKDLREVSYEKLGESKMCIVATPDIIDAIRNRDLDEELPVFKFRHPFEVDVMDKFVRPLVRSELSLRMDTDDIPLLRFFANSGEGIAVLPEVGVLEDLETGAVDAIQLRRCPEVIIYGITMMHSNPIHGAEGIPPLWS